MLTLKDFRLALAANSHDSYLRERLGIALIQRHEYREGLAHLRDVAASRSNDAEAWFQLGKSLEQAGEVEEAAASLRRALALAPEHSGASSVLARLYLERLHQTAEARAVLRIAIAGAPQRTPNYIRLCRVHLFDHPWQEAAVFARAALPPAGEPQRLPAAMGMALMQIGRYEDADECLRAALHDEPRDVDTQLALARTELALGRPAASRSRYEQAWRAHADHPTVTLRYGESLFRMGDVAGAHRIYGDARAQRLMFGRRADVYTGRAACQGRTVLLHQPGGYGDRMQLSAFAQLLQRQGARVILQCPVPLIGLMRTLPDITQVVAPFDDHAAADVVYRLDQVSMALEWGWEDLTARMPAFHPSQTRIDHWRRHLAGDDRLHVGLVWRTSHDSDAHDPYTSRPIPFDRLARLTATPGVAFHALALGPADRAALAAAAPAAPIAPPIAPLADRLGDFLDTAAVIHALDIVVTADTAVAHVAGRMGRPCITLLPYLADPRWGDKAERSDWYPATQLVRQQAPGDWAAPLDRVARELRRRAAGQHADSSEHHESRHREHDVQHRENREATQPVRWKAMHRDVFRPVD